MVTARAKKGFTQADVANMAGVSVNFISCLERLSYPTSYRYNDALVIAEILEIKIEQVLPEKMTGWKGQTKFSTVAEMPVERLLAYKDRAQKHYLLKSPDEAIEKKDDLARVKALVDRLPERKRVIITLRYGLNQELGGPYTTNEIAERLGISGALVSCLSQSAIRLLQEMAGNSLLMRHINAVSLDKIEDEENDDEIECGGILLNEITVKPLKKDEAKI